MKLAWCLLAAATLAAQSTPVAFTGARVVPIAGTEIDSGVVIIQNGRIQAVGPAATAIPPGAQRVDLRGKVIMPGFVDSHSHIGGIDGGDSSGAIHPEPRVLDSINVRDARIQKAQAGGITVANGTNSRRGPPHPGTRAKMIALLRAELIKAREYTNKKDAGIRLGKEFNLKIVLDGVAEAHGMIEAIRASGYPVVVHPKMYRAGGETENLSLETASKLQAAGIPFALQSGFESYVPKTRVMLFEAAMPPPTAWTSSPRWRRSRSTPRACWASPTGSVRWRPAATTAAGVYGQSGVFLASWDLVGEGGH